MRRPDLSTGAWLALGFGAPGLLLSAVVVAAVLLQARIERETAHQLELINPRAQSAAELEIAVFELGVSTRSYAIAPRPERRDAVTRAARLLATRVARFSALPKDVEGAPLADAALDALAPYEAACRAVVDAVPTSSRDEVQRLEADLAPLREVAVERLRAYQALQASNDAEASAAIREAQRRTTRSLLVGFGVVVALAIAVTWTAARQVRDPLRRLADAASAVSSGDWAAGERLGTSSAANARNELARLSSAFAAMSAALRAREDRLATQNEQLRAQQEELQAQNEELRAQEEELQVHNEELRDQQERLAAQNDELHRTAEARRQAEARLAASVEALREADARKDEFLAVLSHELRNPLAPIVNSLRVLDQVGPETEAGQRARRVVARQVAHLSRMVEDLLDVARIARGKVQLRPADVELGALVRHAAEDNASLLEARGVTLEVKLPDRPTWARVDPARIAQVVGNLVQNAAKFTDGGGRVAVSLEAGPDARATIRVRDTGIGMSAEVLDRVFEPFVQAEGTLARTRGGLGLGLALVKGLTELHGGTVRASSDGDGKGSELSVELPMGRAGAARASGAPGPPARRRRVLVIEDNVDAAETLRDVLRLAGHEAEVAFDGREALEKLAGVQPDTILCDLGLPDMDGFELARRLRREPSGRDVMLVALSGYARPEDRERSREAGFDAHLAKPASEEALEALLRDGVPRRTEERGGAA